MATGTENVELTPGFITLTDSHGRKTKYPIADVLRAADIPSLTYVQVGAIKTLANLMVVLIRILRKRDILDEQFMEEKGELSLSAIEQVIESIGGDYSDPDLTDT